MLKFSARCTCRNTDLSSANGAAAERGVRIAFHILINHYFVLLSHLERLLPTAKPNQCFCACLGPAADLAPYQKFPNTLRLSYKINTQVIERFDAGLYKRYYFILFFSCETALKKLCTLVFCSDIDRWIDPCNNF